LTSLTTVISALKSACADVGSLFFATLVTVITEIRCRMSVESVQESLDRLLFYPFLETMHGHDFNPAA